MAAVTPLLTIPKPVGEAAITFYQNVFGAVVLDRRTETEGGLPCLIALLRIGTFDFIIKQSQGPTGRSVRDAADFIVKVPGSAKDAADRATSMGAKWIDWGGFRDDFGYKTRWVKIRDPCGYYWVFVGGCTNLWQSRDRSRLVERFSAHALPYGDMEWIPRLLIPAPRAEEAIDYYEELFGAKEIERVPDPNRRTEEGRPFLTAELEIDGCRFIVAETDDPTPTGVGGDDGAPLAVNFVLHLGFCPYGTFFSIAQEAGPGTELVEESGSGGYFGPGTKWRKFKDPFGHDWIVVRLALLD